MLDNVIMFIIGIALGMAILILSMPGDVNHADLININNAIIECEKSLPRDQQCILTAVPLEVK